MTPRRDATVAAAAPDDVDIPARFGAIDTEAVVDAVLDADAVAKRAPDRIQPADVHAVLEAIADGARAEHPWRDPAVLATLYYEEGLTQAEIADRLGTSQRTVGRWMRRYDLNPGSRTPETFAGLADLGLVDQLLGDVGADTTDEKRAEPTAESWGTP